jgi:hypothetical protein
MPLIPPPEALMLSPSPIIPPIISPDPSTGSFVSSMHPEIYVNGVYMPVAIFENRNYIRALCYKD